MGHHHDDNGDSALAELLDLDGDVLHEYWAEALDWVRQTAGDEASRLIVDLGAGTGTGALGLAHRFTAAEVVAVDTSEEMLDRVRAKTLDHGLAGRIRTFRADLDDGWPIAGPVDVTWASMSLHHLADPGRVLRDVHAATRPGGLIAVAEFAEHPRFLPDAVGRGLEERLLAELRRDQAAQLPELGSDWAVRLAAAGFTLLEERTFELGPAASGPSGSNGSLARYADLWFRRMRHRLTDRLTPGDAETLAQLLDGDGPDTLRRRADLHIRGTRTVTLARA